MNTLLYFTAEWCGPCKRTRPIVEELMRDSQDVKIYIIDVDIEIEMAQDFGIKSIPTFIVMNDNKEIHRVRGPQTKQQLESLISFGQE